MLHAVNAMVVAVRIVNTVVVSFCICRCPVYLTGDCRVGFRCLCWFVIGLWARPFACQWVLIGKLGICAVCCFGA